MDYYLLKRQNGSGKAEAFSLYTLNSKLQTIRFIAVYRWRGGQFCKNARLFFTYLFVTAERTLNTIRVFLNKKGGIYAIPFLLFFVCLSPLICQSWRLLRLAVSVLVAHYCTQVGWKYSVEQSRRLPHTFVIFVCENCFYRSSPHNYSIASVFIWCLALKTTPETYGFISRILGASRTIS